MRRNNVSLVREDGGPVGEPVREALGRIVRTIEGISRGTFKYHSGVKLIIKSTPGYSYHFAGTYEIIIRPGYESTLRVDNKSFGGTNNYGMLAHELAHFISLRDNAYIQNRYTKDVTVACNLTKYTFANRREEFAEVFSSFLTNPDLLNNGTTSCKEAKIFLSDLFGEAKHMASNCESRRESLE